MIKRLPYRLLAFVSTIALAVVVVTVVFAADTIIDSDVSASHVQPGVVWTDGDTAYYFFGDTVNTDFFYRKTTDGGTTWGSAVTLFADATNVVSGAVWYDRWTDGVTGSQIHVAVARDGANDFRYRSIDTASSDALGTDVQVNAFGIAGGSSYRLAITKAENFNLYIKFIAATPANQRFMRSTDSGATWASRTDVTTQIVSTDRFILFPDANASDTADVVMVWADDNAGADTLNLLEYDDSGNSWTATVIGTNVSTLNRQVQATATIRQSDQHIIAAIRDPVTENTDIQERVFDVFGSGSITELTTVVINAVAGFNPAFFVAPNDDIYGVWGGNFVSPDLTGVLYVTSTDDGTTWSGETDVTEDSPDDVAYITVPYAMPGGGTFAPIFVATDPSPDIAYINVNAAISIGSSSSSNGSMAVTGTLGGSGGTPAEIVAGGETIILTLTDTSWVAAGATFDAQRQAIIDGLDSNLSDQNGWDARRSDFAVGDVVRTSASVVTITLTGASAYAIPATETITATAPAAALTTSSAIIGTPTFNVVADFQASGNRVSTAINLSTVTNVAYCALAWEATTPASTTITVDTSIDGGTNYTLGHTNGNCPAGISAGASLATITDFRIRVNVTTTDSSVTPTIRTLSLIIEDDSGQDLYYQLNTTPGVTITDRSTNTNTGTMSYPVTGSAVSSIGILTSTRVGISATDAVRSSDVASPVSGSAVAENLFQEGEEGFSSLPGQSLVAAIASAAPYPIRGVWIAVAGLVVILLGLVGMYLTRSLLVAAILMGLGLVAWAIVGTGIIPGWTIFLFVAMAAAFIQLRPKVPV